MDARLTMVMFFVFLIPVVSLSTLGVRLYVRLQSTGTHISSAVWHFRPQLGCCRLCHSEVFRSNHVLFICFHIGGTSAATFGMNFVV
jgi:hypothetical protein